MLRVIPSLFDVLADVRRAAEISEAQIAALAKVSQQTVRRWENQDNYPFVMRKREGKIHYELHEAVEAYSQATGIPARSLWMRAIEAAEEEPLAEGEAERRRALLDYLRRQEESEDRAGRQGRSKAAR